MNQKEAQELVEQRLRNEPEFRKKYDAFLAKRKAEGKLTDEELSQANGGLFMNVKYCPGCGEYTYTTLTWGLYYFCTNCDYTEWFGN